MVCGLIIARSAKSASMILGMVDRSGASAAREGQSDIAGDELHAGWMTRRVRGPSSVGRARRGVWHVADANVAWLHDNKRIEESRIILAHDLQDALHQSLARGTWKANEDDTSRFSMADMHQPPEVLVLSQEDSLLIVGLFYQIAIDGASHRLAHRIHVEPFRSEGTYHSEIAAFVGKKTQRGQVRHSFG